MITQFLHVGMGVEDIEAAIQLYERLGYNVTSQFLKPEPESKIARLESKDGSEIELLEFTDKTHPHVEILRKHIAFMSDNLEEDLAAMEAQGCETVIPITKGVVLTYAFVRDPSGNYIELAKR